MRSGGFVGDPEIEAMGALASALTDLDEFQRARVLRWACERFEVTGRAASAEPVGRGGVAGPSEPEVESSAAAPQIATTARFDHFAELFDACGPTSNLNKALVAAYWFQVVLGNTTLDGLS